MRDGTRNETPPKNTLAMHQLTYPVTERVESSKFCLNPELTSADCSIPLQSSPRKSSDEGGSSERFITATQTSNMIKRDELRTN